MLALVYVFFLLLYVAFSVVVVIAVGRWAAKRGKVRWKWMTGAAAVMWLIVFWDWIPTVLLHRHLCNTWAGVTIYKTPEQWLAENKDKPREPLKDAKSLTQGNNSFVVALPGERLAIESVGYWYSPLTIRAATTTTIDRVNGTKLVEERSVGAGNPGPDSIGQWRRYFIWLNLEECKPGAEEYLRTDKQLREAAKALK